MLDIPLQRTAKSVAAIGSDGREVASKGTEGSPNIIEIAAAGAVAADTDNPLGDRRDEVGPEVADADLLEHPGRGAAARDPDRVVVAQPVAGDVDRARAAADRDRDAEACPLHALERRWR